MNLKRFLLGLLVVAIFAAGCAKRTLVEIPPRVDLHAFDVIGVVQFESEVEGTLAAYATQRFIQSLQRSQPGVRVLELGDAEELRRTIGVDRIDHAAIGKIREQYDIGAVITGTLDVTDVRPKIDLNNIFSTLSVSAEVDAALAAKLLETERGTTMWTMSTQGTETVAQIGLSKKGPVRFDAQDPDKCYGALVDALIHDVTRDFRVQYARH